MLNITATTILVTFAIAVVVLIVGLLAYQTAVRLDRLHVRVDLSHQALESALARRAAVARAVAATLPAPQAHDLRAAADRAEGGAPNEREVLENQLSRAIGALDLELCPRTLIAEIADADTRVTMARRFHNDAVRDTRALRGRRFVRWLHLGGTAAMPRYFDIVDRSGELPAALLAHGGDKRVSARVILVDRQGAVLLVQGHDPRRPDSRFWFTPGGAVESGEDLTGAAIREVREETGRVLAATELVGPVFRREAQFVFDGVLIDSVEFFFSAAVDRYDPQPAGLTELEVRTIDSMRWCTVAEIRTFSQPVFPRSLADLLPQIGAAPLDGPVPID